MSTTSKVMMGLGAANSIFQHGSENRAIRARNRAKLANFQAENDAYIVDQMMQDVAWKDRVSSAEVSIDNLFQQTSQSWNQQDVEMEAVYAKHAFDALEILTQRYKNEYAGEQTGVTAARLADEPVRQAGMALTQSVANVILNKNKAQINKEIALEQYKSGFREKWDAVRIAPQRGPTPIAPTLEKEAGTGSLLGRIALGVGSSLLMANAGKILGKGKNWLLNRNKQNAVKDIFDWNATGQAPHHAFNTKFNFPSVTNRSSLLPKFNPGLSSILGPLPNIGYQGNPAYRSFFLPNRPRYSNYYQGVPDLLGFSHQ